MLKRLALAALLVAPAAQAADKRISDLPLASSLSGGETLPVILQDNITMKRASIAQIVGLAAWNQWRGPWSSATNYIINDVVQYNGASYIAIQASNNQTPSPGVYWQLVASKGADGNGVGTVTSIVAGTGLSGGTITSSGTIALTAPVTVALGGTNATSASGTALDNITGWASTGFIKRTGTGAYAFVADPLPVSNGGLGIGSGTSGGVPCFTASTTVASSNALGANNIVLGGGAGVCPTVVGSLGTTTTLLHGNASGAPSFAALGYADVDAGAISTNANVTANAASKLVSVNALWGSQGVTALTDTATIAVDMSTGVNFGVTLAGNRSLGNPTNPKVGQSGVIRVVQDAAGSRTLSYGTAYKWASGTACVLSTTANRVDYLFYFVYSATEVLLNCILDVR